MFELGFCAVGEGAPRGDGEERGWKYGIIYDPLDGD